MHIRQETSISSLMRVTDRLPRDRPFPANFTSQSHKSSPSENSSGGILADCRRESKPIKNPAHSNYALQFLKGVGPARAQALARIGILDTLDLIHTFPRDWEDRRISSTFCNVIIGERATLRGRIVSVDFSVSRNNLGLVCAILSDPSGEIRATWFKKMTPRYDVFASLKQRLLPERHIVVTGTVEWGPGGRQIRVDDLAVCEGLDHSLPMAERVHFDRIVPVYSSTEGISERLLRSLVYNVLHSPTTKVPNLLPDALVKKYDLRPRRWAMEQMHFPDSLLEKERAREVLAFEEFLLLEVALGVVRQQFKKQRKLHHYTLRRTLLTPFREQLAFQFTTAQKTAIREIFNDMLRETPMNRLLQGDVGSGKTIVALSAMLLAVESGGQAALMVPTEILAEQHAITFSRFLKGLRVRHALIVGRQSKVQRKAILKDISTGAISLVIGTHALIQKTVTFKNLMLAIVDEQHRFGVEHRVVLRQKGNLCDVLVMTATPIPRTLALTVYGDLDISTIDHLPPGRPSICTRQVEEEEAYTQIRKKVSEGRQAYIVFPLVEESDKSELKATVQEAQTLSLTEFKEFRVGVLHGQLPSREKESIMERFRQHEIDILIATSIIEVGIDVPNATIIVIHHSDRFGLATLHQLRGRVGRSHWPSSCYLLTDLRTPEALRRIKVMEQITDGFRLSEEDLAIRGPGEVLGAMQHGIPGFRLGHIIWDARLIQQARASAQSIFETDPNLQWAVNQRLKTEIFQRYGSKWLLGATA